MTELIGPATWYVAEGDREGYADAVRACGGKVKETGALTRSRNAALDDAAAEGALCVQVSDDLRRCQLIEVRAGKKTARPTTFAETVARLSAELARTDFRLAGCAPTGNAFYFDERKPVKTRAFVVGDLIAVDPRSSVRFDEELRLKEDYDFTLAHVVAHGGVVRCDALAPQFAHRTNAGGAVAYRTEQEEERAIAHLVRRWGSAIARNPRRPHEILLRWPKPKRS